MKISDHQRRLTPEEKAQKLVYEADANKAEVCFILGKHNVEDVNKQFHSVLVDKDYLLVTSHVDSTTLN